MTSSTPKRRHRRTGSQWSRLISEQASSGLSEQAFCTRHDLGLSTFYKWKRKLNDVGTLQPSPGAFIEFPLSDDASQPGFELELELGEGMRLRLRRG